MHWRGHVGLTLLVLSSLAYILELRGINYLVIIVLATLLCSLPDIDISLEIPHRKYTHNVFFGLAVATGFGYATEILFNDFNLGFTSMFAAFILHIVGDLMTYQPFKPLAPFQRRGVSYKLFRSSNKVVNDSLAITGLIAFIIYLIYTVLGVRLI